MAEGYTNKKLLIVAVILGVVSVGLSQWRDISRERARAANRTYVVRVTTDLEPGQVLTEQNVQAVGLDVDAGSLKGLVMWEGEAGIKNGLGVQQIKRRVEKNTILQFADIGQADTQDRGPSEKVRAGWQIIPLQVDSSQTASAYIRRGDRVDVYGAVVIPGRPLQMQLIIEALEVMAVGPQIEAGTGTTRQDFRTISVQVPEDVVPLLLEVTERRIVGRLTLGVRNPDAYEKSIKFPYSRTPKDGGTIAKPIMDSLATPLPTKAEETVGR